MTHLSHKLILKIEAPMLLRNLYPPKLCNETRLQIKALYKNVIKAIVRIPNDSTVDSLNPENNVDSN
ncbi:ATP-dependent DNA helicase PIF1-like [Aphis craccivora]|uniref:ATP-dependent DNA helicase PIF1-like n=1 Tax=Aphis craccivora TaxID=307492 RepID=A0A6G0Z492_APHCR|nr:ATP-dependent DNA helicase PIF1-like [Aphis craccivora]